MLWVKKKNMDEKNSPQREDTHERIIGFDPKSVLSDATIGSASIGSGIAADAFVESSVNDIMMANLGKREKRLCSVESSNWTVEELKLLSEWENVSKRRAIGYATRAHQLERRSTWISLIINVTSVILGSGGCASFVAKAAAGDYDWSDLVFGVVMLGSGIGGAVAKSFRWDRKTTDNDMAADRYRSIANAIRTAKSEPCRDRIHCQVCVTNISNRVDEAEAVSPYLEVFPDDATSKSSVV